MSETPRTGWAVETMLLINKLTPDVKGKAFDPDWFLLRQRFEEVEREVAALREVAASIRRRGEVLIAADDEYLSPMGNHYIGIADELDAALEGHHQEPAK